MADKFTRLTIADGDVFFADSNTDNDSIEEFEDNIDAGLFGYSGTDQTEGSIASSTTETEIGEVQVAANSVNTGILVIATGKVTGLAGTGTIKLYGGTSTTGTSNTLFKTVTRLCGIVAVAPTESGWTIVFYIDSLTWTNLNYINITGENSLNGGNDKCTCESIEILRI